MKIKKLFVLFYLILLPLPLWAETQYKPQSSFERHEFSFGSSISLTSKPKKALSVPFLKYTLYVPEISNLLVEPYNKIFTPGLSAGANLFLSKDRSKNYGICESEEVYPLVYHLGLKVKVPYFEFFQPFAESGLARSSCYSKNIKVFKSQKKLSYYLSYGLFLSLKILDRVAVYTLDQDYGINDVGVKAECLRYYPKDKEKSFNFCQFGFQFSF